MKLHKVLAIGGAPYVLVKNEVRLDAKSPGRATFTIQATAPVKGLVTLDIGYNDSTLQRHFIGYVERSITASSTQQVLFCQPTAAEPASRRSARRPGRDQPAHRPALSRTRQALCRG